MKKIFFLFLININFIIFSEIKFLGDLFDVRLKDTEKKKNQEFLKHFNFIREIPWQDIPKYVISISDGNYKFLLRVNNLHHIAATSDKFAATSDKWFTFENHEDLIKLLEKEGGLCWEMSFYVHNSFRDIAQIVFKEKICDDCIIL